MTPFQSYLLILNTILVAGIFIIAIYFIRSYNVLVTMRATNTPALPRDSKPAARVIDRVEISIDFQEINYQREAWLKAGYSVSAWSRAGNKMNLTLTKKEWN